MAKNYDFSGWATKNNLKCADGRTIRKDAFKHNDGATVPLVWNHKHDDPLNVLGHAVLENREEGVYAYGYFNETVSGQDAKELVKHGDIVSLSIYANRLKQNGGDVLHGDIREVSLVLAGANPGAWIDDVMYHSEFADDEGVIYPDDACIEHADKKDEEEKEEPEVEESEEESEESEEPEKEEDSEEEKEDKKIKHSGEEKVEKKTIGEIFDTLSEEQKDVVYLMIGQAINDAKGEKKVENKGEEKDMKHNVFDKEQTQETLAHADMMVIFDDAQRCGSLKEAVMAHAEEGVLAHAVYNEDGSEQTYGIADIDWLFPEAKKISNSPEFYKREDEWVSTVMNGVHKTPFSRVKSMFADITMDEARAKGYIKGNEKAEEVFGLLKRETSPQTIYKKQKLDKDDIRDITDFDVVVWLKGEMRIMLDEEAARAILVGDGRTTLHPDKIKEDCIRPIWKDDDFYTIKAQYVVPENATEDQAAKLFIRKAVKARKDYRGSGNPVLFTTEDVLTDCLLMEDSMGRVIYDTEEKLRTALRVSKIVTVPIMEGLKRKVDGVDYTLMGLIVNLNDYNVGADKGGQVEMFEDFDIDYNREKYLIESRFSGAMIKPKSAIAIEAAFGEDVSE